LWHDSPPRGRRGRRHLHAAPAAGGASMSQPLLHAEGISVRGGRRVASEPCEVTISPGEVVGIYGPNGAGKSTLLQALAGLLPLASGHLRFDGRCVGRDLSAVAYHRHTAAVFQEPLLLRGTVGYNI